MWTMPRLALALACAIAGVLAAAWALGLAETLPRLTLVAAALAVGTVLLAYRAFAVAAQRVADWMKLVRSGAADEPPPASRPLRPLVLEAARLAQSLAEARAAAE